MIKALIAAWFDPAHGTLTVSFPETHAKDIFSAMMNYGQAETLPITVSSRIHPESRLWLRDFAERL